MAIECVELTTEDYARAVLEWYVPNAHLLENEALDCYNKAVCMQMAYLDKNPSILDSLGTVVSASTRNYSVSTKSADEYEGDIYVAPLAYRKLLGCGLVSSKLASCGCECLCHS